MRRGSLLRIDNMADRWLLNSSWEVGDDELHVLEYGGKLNRVQLHHS